ncbi:MAG: MoaD/ThiS family protein, partial [Chloroflexota bacterium]
MKIKVKLFARMRELIGHSVLERELPENSTVATLVALLEDEFPNLGDAAPRTVISLNREFTEIDTVLHDGDEVAFFPPVSGGSDTDDGKFAITSKPIGSN